MDSRGSNGFDAAENPCPLPTKPHHQSSAKEKRELACKVAEAKAERLLREVEHKDEAKAAEASAERLLREAEAKAEAKAKAKEALAICLEK